jgi:hypothetical protein
MYFMYNFFTPAKNYLRNNVYFLLPNVLEQLNTHSNTIYTVYVCLFFVLCTDEILQIKKFILRCFSSMKEQNIALMPSNVCQQEGGGGGYWVGVHTAQCMFASTEQNWQRLAP